MTEIIDGEAVASDIRDGVAECVDTLDEAGFADIVARVNVFARVAPEHKLRIVDALQAEVVFGELVDELGLTLIFVSHDLSVVRHVCERVAVMRRGELVELAPTEQLWSAPGTDYTRSLIEAIPRMAV